MPRASVNGVEIHYEVTGAGPPLLLLAGLGGEGRGWGAVRELFASELATIVPDHRGTGGSSRPDDGYTIEAHAADMAQLLRALGVGPTHVVGSSTGGAIAQVMALDHPDVVASITLVSSWARGDDFFRHQFTVRKRALLELGREAYAELSALFLFSPRYLREHYGEVRAWVESAAGSGTPTEVMARRIDMVTGFDVLDRLAGIRRPTLVLVGEEDGCTPPYFSEELARHIDQAELRLLPGGHLVYKEHTGEFHAAVRGFLARLPT